MKLKDKVALITGASRGIGRATALLFAKEGAKVAVNYNRSEKEAVEVVASIKDGGSEAITVKCDVSDESQIKKMVDEVIEKFGRIDILVNNAGIVFDIPFFEKTNEQWQKTLQTNLIGTFLCMKYVGPHMVKQKYGKIVNVASTNGIDAYDSTSADYDASKAGVIVLTKASAEIFAPFVSVNCVAPGWVDTDINKDLPKDYVKEETEKIYLKRFAKPEEIAKTILFLASEDASFITGSVLVADGGYR